MAHEWQEWSNRFAHRSDMFGLEMVQVSIFQSLDYFTYLWRHWRICRFWWRTSFLNFVVTMCWFDCQSTQLQISVHQIIGGWLHSKDLNTEPEYRTPNASGLEPEFIPWSYCSTERSCFPNQRCVTRSFATSSDYPLMFFARPPENRVCFHVLWSSRERRRYYSHESR
jgi:hypothetical protein